MSAEVIQGDCLAVMRTMEAATAHPQLELTDGAA